MILDLSTAASNFDKTKRRAEGVEEWGRREKWGIIEITTLRQRQQEVVTASVLDKARTLFLFHQFAREKFLCAAQKSIR